MKIFDLSPREYNRFLLLFDENREKAGEKYERLIRKLTMIFSKRGCHNIDELVDKVFDQIYTMLVKGKTVENIDNLSHYIAKRHTLHRYWNEVSKNQQTFVSVNDEFVIDIDNFINQNSQEERLKNNEDLIFEEILHNSEDEKSKRLIHLRFCIDKLAKTPDEKKMILGYYCSDNQKAYLIRKKLAEDLGISAGNLRIRVNRLQEKLFNCINNCLEKELR